MTPSPTARGEAVDPGATAPGDTTWSHRAPPFFRSGLEPGGVIARHIDHVNLRIPSDGVDDAKTFYGERLGFGIEEALYEADEKPFFDVRLSSTAVIHLWPTDEFEPPTATNFDHACVVVEESIEAVTDRLADEGVEVEAELSAPLGATGEAPAVYVTDPFGYRIELKERV